VLNLFSPTLLLLFVNKESTTIIRYARTYILFGSSTYILLSLVNIVRFTIQGLGFSQFAIFAGLLEMIARTIAAFALVPVLGYYGVCLADPLAWIFADCFLIPAYFRCIRVCRKRMESVK
jgi:Na+-driven multidrug efflux pump